jgi:hypothetical protein
MCTLQEKEWNIQEREDDHPMHATCQSFPRIPQTSRIELISCPNPIQKGNKYTSVSLDREYSLRLELVNVDTYIFVCNFFIIKKSNVLIKKT